MEKEKKRKIEENEKNKKKRRGKEGKAAAYYDELIRKGGGAARFKEGLGFSSELSTTAAPSKAPSFLINFVRAPSPTKAAQLEK